VDVSNQREQISVFLDHESLVPALKQMTDAAVPPVEPLRVCRLKREHHARQLRRPSFHGQVQMVAHQAVGQDTQPEPFATTDQPIQVLSPVMVVSENEVRSSRTGITRKPIQFLKKKRPLFAAPLDD